MESGIELITTERQEQLKKHGRTVEDDVSENDLGQLAEAARILSQETIPLAQGAPIGWSSTIWDRMIEKPYEKRVIIAGALLAAEYDRLTHIAEEV